MNDLSNTPPARKKLACRQRRRSAKGAAKFGDANHEHHGAGHYRVVGRRYLRTA